MSTSGSRTLRLSRCRKREQWVGTERGTFGPSLYPPRWDWACDLHRTQPPPARKFTLVSFPSPSTRVHWPYHWTGSYFEAPYKLWPFALYAAFPRSDYYDHADCLLGPWRICGVFRAHSLALLRIPERLSRVRSDGLINDAVGGG